jgi:hypothetical protein
MKAVELLNPESFYISMAGIGFLNKKGKCLLVAFRKERIIFKREYIGLENAMRGFSNVFNNDEGVKPEWSDFFYCYSFDKNPKTWV